MYIGLRVQFSSVSISTELRACVWNVHCVPNLVFEEHRSIRTPGRGNTYSLLAEIQARMYFFVVEGALLSGSNIREFRARFVVFDRVQHSLIQTRS
jgi:hypothetical protein